MAYQSVATAAWQSITSGANLSITKPTGLAAGDVMIAHLSNTSNNADIGSGTGLTEDFFSTPTDWTLLGSLVDGAGEAVKIQVFGKTATSGDAAASTFPFTYQGSQGQWVGGSLYRYDNVNFSGIQIALASTTGASPSFANTLTPSVANCEMLMLISVVGNNNSGSGASYAIATDNPTWTERVDMYGDASVHYGAGDGDSLMLGASASRTQTTATGNSSASLAGVTDYSICAILALPPITNVTVTPTVLAATLTVQAPTVSGSAVVAPAVLSSTLAVQAPTVTVTARKWDSPDKSAATTVTNPDKS